MTTIVFDGQTMAADRMADRQGLKCPITKIWRIANGDVLAVTGRACHAQTMKQWYEAGALPDKYPGFQSDDDKCCTLVVMSHGRISAYYSQPYPVREDGMFTAFGSGRDFAIAAMACGKEARGAIQVASLFDVNTGLGVDWFSVDGSSGHLTS